MGRSLPIVIRSLWGPRHGGQVRPADDAGCAFGAGASVASKMLTTEAIITDLPEPKAAPAGSPGGLGGMEDMY